MEDGVEGHAYGRRLWRRVCRIVGGRSEEAGGHTCEAALDVFHIDSTLQ